MSGDRQGSHPDQICSLLKPNRYSFNHGQETDIRKESHEILAAIAEEIGRAQKERRKSLIFPLPTQFNIHGIDNATAQRKIWFTVLKELKNKEYSPIIDPKADKCYLILKLHITEEDDLKQMEAEFIAKHSLAVVAPSLAKMAAPFDTQSRHNSSKRQSSAKSQSSSKQQSGTKQSGSKSQSSNKPQNGSKPQKK
jgi:hypothetical protein